MPHLFRGIEELDGPSKIFFDSWLRVESIKDTWSKQKMNMELKTTQKIHNGYFNITNQLQGGKLNKNKILNTWPLVAFWN